MVFVGFCVLVLVEISFVRAKPITQSVYVVKRIILITFSLS